MLRTLESQTRMKFLLGNNPMGELIRIVQTIYKTDERKQTPMGKGDK